MATNSETQLRDDEINLKELVGVILRGKWLILAVTVLATLGIGLAAWLIMATVVR